MPTLDNDLISKCDLVVAIAKQAFQDDLRDVFEAAREQAKIYTFKERYKKPSAVRAKVIRKRQEGADLKKSYDQIIADAEPRKKTAAREENRAMLERAQALAQYTHESVTDVWGCRFVTLYQSDIPIIVEWLLIQLHSYNTRSGNEEIRADEVVIYTNRPPNDPLSIAFETDALVRRIAENGYLQLPEAVIRQPENRKSAYSSVHFVFSRYVAVQVPPLGKVHKRVAFEVQIRDIFEEGWGEVQHDLLYSEKDLEYSVIKDREARTRKLAFHLNALKTIVDGCSQNASIIRSQMDEIRSTLAATNKAQSSSSRREDQADVVHILDRSRSASLVYDAYSLLIAGDETALPDAARRRYEDASVAFKKAIKGLPKLSMSRKIERVGGRSVRYYLLIELGNSLFLTAEEPLVDPGTSKTHRREIWLEAHNLFATVAEENPDDPTALFRLAKALSRLNGDADFGTLGERIDGLAKAGACLDACIAAIHGDPLTGAGHWLPILARVERGTILWKRSTWEKGGQRSRLVKEALDESIRAYEYWLGQPDVRRHNDENRVGAHKAAANVLYYAGELLLRGVDVADARATIELYLDRLAELNVDPGGQYFKTRDNLMHALFALARIDDARKLANETYLELRSLAELRAESPLDGDQIISKLIGSERACFKAAQAVIAGNSPVGR